MAMTKAQILALPEEEQQTAMANIITKAKQLRQKVEALRGRPSALTRMLAAEPLDPDDTDQDHEVPAGVVAPLAG